MSGSLFVGTIKYDTFTFPANYDLHVRSVPIYDTPRRAVKYRKYLITVRTIVDLQDLNWSAIVGGGSAGRNQLFAPAAPPPNPSSTSSYANQTDYYTIELYRILTTPGRVLTIKDTGFGNFTIAGNKGTAGDSATQTYIDADFGPKPIDVDIRAIANRALAIDWSCEFSIIHLCGSGTDGSGSGSIATTPTGSVYIGEFWFGITYSIDEARLTTRTIQGYAEIASDRNGATVNQTADTVRTMLNFPFLPGFKRSDTYSVTPDKKGLNFTINDRELDTDFAYPQGVTEIQAVHEVRPDSEAAAMAGILWRDRISAHIRLAPGAPRSLAWTVFKNIVADRISHLDPSTQIIKFNDISLQESIFTREFDFNVAFLLSTTLDTLIKDSGLFQPLNQTAPGNSWDLWVASINQLYTAAQQNILATSGPYAGQLGPTGAAGLNFPLAGDVIVDFCTKQYPGSPKSRSAYPGDSPPPDPVTVGCPPAEKSWIAYRNSFEFHRITGTVYTPPTGNAKSLSQSQPSLTMNSDGNMAVKDAIGLQSGSSSQTDGVYARSGDTIILRMSGLARRVNTPPSVPKVVSIGGQPPTVKSESIHGPTIDGYSGKCPIYLLYWVVEYYVSTIADAQNPTIQIQGQPSWFKPDLPTGPLSDQGN